LRLVSIRSAKAVTRRASAMADIDPQSDIELLASDEELVARIPLIGDVTDVWLRTYRQLARADRVPAHVETGSGRAWLVVKVPANGSHRDVTGTMDSARALIALADQAAEHQEAMTNSSDIVRSWWADRHVRASRKPISRTEVVRTGIGTDKRWILALALSAAIAVLLVLPPRFDVGPAWLVPAIEGLLLIAILIAGSERFMRQVAIVRMLWFAFILVLVGSAAFITIRLVIDLLKGGPETNSATDLLEVGAATWVYTVIAFAFLYWLLDGGGPDARIWSPPMFPDLAFPEQLNPQVAPPGWRPQFLDYVYLGFTDATAFSPTDVMPLALWAKVTMAVQAAASFTIGGLVIARAVNIFR
jgi:hypothetical protein